MKTSLNSVTTKDIQTKFDKLIDYISKIPSMTEFHTRLTEIRSIFFK